jgi:hypothetical protein
VPVEGRAVAVSGEPIVRDASADDVAAICHFGEAHIRDHYAPLIGATAADEQVRRWWNEQHISSAVAAGLVVAVEQKGRAKSFHHTAVGDLELAYESVDMLSEPGLTLTIYAAEPASRTAEALSLLASLTAPEPTPRHPSRPSDRP